MLLSSSTFINQFGLVRFNLHFGGYTINKAGTGYWVDWSSSESGKPKWLTVPGAEKPIIGLPGLEIGSTFVRFDDPSGQGGMTGLPENNFIKYSVEGTSVWAGTIQTGFDAARKLQPTVSTWIKGAKVLGKTSNFLGGVSITYDFATGTANSSTIADGLVMAGGAAALFFGGVALAPWVAGAGVVYGIVSISGGEAWLNRNIDISGYVNIVKPSKP
jgi:hypothetical protein